MRVLWLCNIMLPKLAKVLGIISSNKEGWLTGLEEELTKHQAENDIKLGVCFPADLSIVPQKKEVEGVTYYGFSEDTVNPEVYSDSLETQLSQIVVDFKPDVVHIFGTEYSHTLAMTKCMKYTGKVVIGIQGICFEYAAQYMYGLPLHVRRRFTVRDFLKQDSIKQQQDKFIIRGEHEIQALQNVTHIMGRTAWDKEMAMKINSNATYYVLNENLRTDFYDKQWNIDKCERNTIFISQANYPLKGFHFFLQALPLIKAEYPDIKVFIAGDIITRHDTLYSKIKISSYGKYCIDLMKKNKLEENIVFLGKLDSEAMCEQYLKSHIFLSPSVLENSPNSVGEAMILGMPVVSSDVGGVASMLVSEKEGLLYQCDSKEQLSDAVNQLLKDDTKAVEYGNAARKKALITHDPKRNYNRLLEIYQQLVTNRSSK